MAKSKTIEATAEFRKDTAKGKKHFAIDGDFVGAVYISAEQFKALGEPGEVAVTIMPVGE